MTDCLEHRDADSVITTRPGKGNRKLERIRLVGFEYVEHEPFNKNHILFSVFARLAGQVYTQTCLLLTPARLRVYPTVRNEKSGTIIFRRSHADA